MDIAGLAAIRALVARARSVDGGLVTLGDLAEELGVDLSPPPSPPGSGTDES